MAQTVQIVPKFSFPYVTTVINDYTREKNVAIEKASDTSIKQVYAGLMSKGIDNTWVKVSSRDDAVKRFGDSDFNKYGQPYMQALEVLDRDNSQVWLMRVMPESAKYANNVLYIGYKADDFTNENLEPHNAKFRIKVKATPVASVTSDAELKASFADAATTDGEGYTTKAVLGIRYTGRGKCGNYYSVRMSKAVAAEKEAGINLYNFEPITSETTIKPDVTSIVGSIVTTNKYKTATLVDDVISDAEVGVSPLYITANEDAVADIYNAYRQFLETAQTKISEEYESVLATSNLTNDELTGKVAVSGAKAEALNKLRTIESTLNKIIGNVPDLDGFDPFFGYVVGGTTQLPMFKLVETVPANADLTGLNAADFTTDTLVDLTSVKGCILYNGNDGEFANPSTVTVNGQAVARTFEEEVERALINAYNGNYDKKILSSRRMPIDAYFDANYPMSVKEEIVKLADIRNDRHVWLDSGIVESISAATVNTLASRFANINTSSVSTDINGYVFREKSTNKKCKVTISMFLAPAYVDHVNNVGFNIPFVKDRCELSGHVKDSLFPLITDADTSIQSLLYDNRLNYFECVGENEYQRCVQNTTQKDPTDLLEEHNDVIVKTLKMAIENDVRSQLYNFADESVRQNFITVETAKFASWNNNIVKQIDITFRTSEYEFEKSILHLYVAVTLRGITKQVILEIDLNKREYTNASTNTEE